MESIAPTISSASGLLPIPIAPRMMKITTRPADGTAAAPIDASRAVRTTTTWVANPMSAPSACAMNSAPTHSMTAVPSMLTVAPMGSVNEDTRSDTPTFSRTVLRVTGSVAAEELVENATSRGSRMFIACFHGDTRPQK